MRSMPQISRGFNSRPRVGGDFPAREFTKGQTFQLTPPCRGRQFDASRSSKIYRFNSRPRVGGDKSLSANPRLVFVSTHAPV